MIPWLDWKLFGNGRGLKSPYFDDVFYWLGAVYSRISNDDRAKGHFYTWIGGFGAQLQSIEWRVPRAGTRRNLLGEDFIVFHATRKWLRVRIAWARDPGFTAYDEVAVLYQKLKQSGN